MKKKDQRAKTEQQAQADRAGWVRRETAIFLSAGALAVGLLAGAVVGAIWEHRLGKPRPAAPPQEAQAPMVPPGPTPEQRTALKELETRVQKDPNDVEAWVQLGDLNYDTDRPMEAIRAYEQALSLKPGNPDVITDLATMYRRVRQPQKAAELFREAHRIDPKHANSLYNLGVVLLHDLNDVKGATAAWEEYIKVVPQGPQSDRIRAMLQKFREEGKLQ
jgi:cytochrome c-type biogenesis protein CcmH/NrfG